LSPELRITEKTANMAGDGPPLSLRPIPVANREPKNLAEFIAWANQQPGGFRALDEVKLREQITADQEAKRKEENGEAPQVAEDEEDVDMEEEQEEDDGDVLKDAEKAREEVMKNVEYVP
jgi:mediator of RNA polymerase II transcription subunit 17, fungi type